MAHIYQLGVTLAGIEPLIWRRLRVRGETSLHELHEVLQIAMGWKDSHLHRFEVDERHFALPNGDEDGEDPPEDERKSTLGDLALRQGSELNYVYDFGDQWDHRILVEAILPPQPGESYPCCVEGERACPPEDSGGIPGYSELLWLLADPNHTESRQWVGWLPKGFDPAVFDAERATQRLRRVSARASKRARRRR